MHHPLSSLTPLEEMQAQAEKAYEALEKWEAKHGVGRPLRPIYLRQTNPNMTATQCWEEWVKYVKPVPL